MIEIQQNGLSALNARDAFLVARQSGIGGSDIGAILSVSPFKSAVDVFLAKTTPDPSDAQTELTYWGQAVEPIILNRFSEDHGVEIIRPQAMVCHAEHPWMVGHLDGMIADEPAGVIEAKNVNAFSAKAWGEAGSDEVPLAYIAQVAWYMAIREVGYAVIAALFGGNTYREFRVERDLELEQTLIQKGREFWRNHVLTGLAPEPQTLEDAVRLFRRDDGTTFDADDAILACCTQLQTAKAQAKRVHDEVERLEMQIKARMGQAARLAYRDQTLATWKTQTSRRFDIKAFMSAHPELYEQFRQVSETRIFRLK